MSINFEITTDEHERIERAANFLKQTVSEFAAEWLFAGVQACEDDYISHDGEVIGDRLKIEQLAKECL
jgi:hypothetical protein